MSGRGVMARWLFSVWGLLALGGCAGDVDLGGPAGPAGLGRGGGARSPAEAGYDPDDAAGLADRPAPTTRLARLTHAQWANSVRDLLGVDPAPYLEGLRADPAESGFLFGNNVQSMNVDEALRAGYARAAEAAAEQVTADPARLAAVAPEPRDAASWVETFGARVHRRPLDEVQRDAYLALFSLGPELYEGMGTFEAGVRVTLEAMLQSPHFLYRVERSEQARGEVIPLDGYEVASRLSYLLWDSMPDDVLFAAAERGALARAQEVEAQVRRMLDDPRAEDVVARFYAQLFESDRLESIAPNEAFYSVGDGFGRSARREHDLFVRDLFRRDLGLTQLLTSTETFVNAELAGVYGLEGDFGADFVGVSLDPRERRGILTQVGFLALHSSSVDPDPIHRGVFIARRVACLNLAAPPDQVPPLPDPAGRTNRQRVADHTEAAGSTCAGCHANVINPFGFPFESYDAVGAYRREELGMPVDTAAAPPIDGEPLAVADALQLAEALAASEGVHECFARHWVEFAHGRPRAAEDATLVARLSQASRAAGASVRELIVQLIKSESFLTRSTEEL